MTLPVSGLVIDRFYRAAVLGLGLLEARSETARRFGPDADARWKAFRVASRTGTGSNCWSGMPRCETRPGSRRAWCSV